jgi:hypothetical protein
VGIHVTCVTLALSAKSLRQRPRRQALNHQILGLAQPPSLTKSLDPLRAWPVRYPYSQGSKTSSTATHPQPCTEYDYPHAVQKPRFALYTSLLLCRWKGASVFKHYGNCDELVDGLQTLSVRISMTTLLLAEPHSPCTEPRTISCLSASGSESIQSP